MVQWSRKMNPEDSYYAFVIHLKYGMSSVNWIVSEETSKGIVRFLTSFFSFIIHYRNAIISSLELASLNYPSN